jgi:hypothetical protein
MPRHYLNPCHDSFLPNPSLLVIHYENFHIIVAVNFELVVIWNVTFRVKDGGSRILRNVGKYVQHYALSRRRSPQSHLPLNFQAFGPTLSESLEAPLNKA